MHRKLIVNAQIVISSAGSIHTPALLLRSGFTHPKIGKHLTLHPVLGAGGLYPKDIDTGLGSGVSMGVVVRNPPITVNTVQNDGRPVRKNFNINKRKSDAQFEEEEAHPLAIETPPVHPGLLGLMLPWNNGMQFKIANLGWRNFGLFIAISRDRSQAANCVTIDARLWL